MSASTDPATSTGAATSSDDGWWNALACYVIAYCTGTIGLDLAEPTSESLFFPAVGIAGVVKLASVTRHFPRGTAASLAIYLSPIVVAVVVVAVMA